MEKEGTRPPPPTLVPLSEKDLQKMTVQEKRDLLKQTEDAIAKTKQLRELSEEAYRLTGIWHNSGVNETFFAKQNAILREASDLLSVSIKEGQ
ncbi:hypothetical protein H2200_012771 [Cladophialophora chaetospira]|uniref:Uncharacterized protein n=1 Tax=Cladophialophora chaetospira TaxID=386627 RepID=A0AA38WWR4_9EURO|nr:hypothetical protein H2200_012771 [Cladophialophora chaetospira]